MGVIRISETELLQSVEDVAELTGRRLFFSPNATGRSLTLYVASDEPVAAAVRDQVDTKLRELNMLYAGELEPGGTMEPLRLREMPVDSAIWQLKHAQSKPYLLRHTPLDEMV